jgi:hypothetical protein
MQPRHHGADGRAHSCRGFPVGQALDVDEIHGDAELVRQCPERTGELGRWHPVESLLFCRPRRRRVMRPALDRAQLLEVGDDDEGLALTLAITGDERVAEDRLQPGAQVRARPKVVVPRAGPGERFLDEVFGVLA